jgi:hypothetical protein
LNGPVWALWVQFSSRETRFRVGIGELASGAGNEGGGSVFCVAQAGLHFSGCTAACCLSSIPYLWWEVKHTARIGRFSERVRNGHVVFEHSTGVNPRCVHPSATILSTRSPRLPLIVHDEPAIRILLYICHIFLTSHSN